MSFWDAVSVFLEKAPKTIRTIDAVVERSLEQFERIQAARAPEAAQTSPETPDAKRSSGIAITPEYRARLRKLQRAMSSQLGRQVSPKEAIEVLISVAEAGRQSAGRGTPDK